MHEQTLPVPVGFRLLVKMYVTPEKTSSGLYRPENAKALEDSASICAQVIALGPAAYKDIEKFPSGPWAKEFDWIVIRAYSGTRLKITGEEYRLINDDMVEAVVIDPAKVERA
jgi:co-chaperonin GroES (HSP10)